MLSSPPRRQRRVAGMLRELRFEMLTVWGRRSSFNLQKVMWLVGELGLEHRHIAAGGQFGGLDAPEFRAMNRTVASRSSTMTA